MRFVLVKPAQSRLNDKPNISLGACVEVLFRPRNRFVRFVEARHLNSQIFSESEHVCRRQNEVWLMISQLLDAHIKSIQIATKLRFLQLFGPLCTVCQSALKDGHSILRQHFFTTPEKSLHDHPHPCRIVSKCTYVFGYYKTNPRLNSFGHASHALRSRG